MMEKLGNITLYNADCMDIMRDMAPLQEMDALSLFDGMGCAWITLKELGITPRHCFSSEIDKHAIAQVKLNFPWVKHLGDVLNWQSWPIDWARVGILFAGSPCQGFSFAGKQLAFDDPRSALFFVFIDILNHIRKFNPGVKFMLENVNMKREHMRVINEYTGVFPVNINSNLVSAQNRDRWYWSNIRTRRDGLFGEVYTDIPQPKDRGLLLNDILDDDVSEKYYLSEKMVSWLINHADKRGSEVKLRVGEDKASCLTSAQSKGNLPSDYVVCHNLAPRSGKTGNGGTGHLSRDDGKAYCIQASSQVNAIERRPIQLNPAQEFGTQPRQQHRYYSPDGLSPALNTCQGGGLETKIFTKGTIRRLTPTECARLQTIPDWYKWGCSETQQYKMLGNGWTIEVIKHILQYL
jgi:DNA (cytosine-5)-methyltransferase 3A